MLVSHATGVANLRCYDKAEVLIKNSGTFEEGFVLLKRCDTDSEAIWGFLLQAYKKQEAGQMAPCEVRDAAWYLEDMGQGHLAVVQDALAEAQWAAKRCAL